MDEEFFMKINKTILSIAATLLLCLSISIQVNAKKMDIKIVQLGSSKAIKGGTFYKSMSSEPKILHPINSTDYYASVIQGFVMDTLMVLNPETYEFEPGLATSVDVGKNNKSYTFYIRKGVRFHDGKPLTAKDVKFSFDAIMDNNFKAAHSRPYFENIKAAVLIDKHTIRFDIKTKYFNNFRVLAALSVVPYHIYKNPKAKVNKILIGSGPYKLGKYIKGKSLVLKRNPNWWGFKTNNLKTSYNYDKILYRFIKSNSSRLAYLKKGKIDYDPLTAEQYVKKTSGGPWGKTILKKKVQNKSPKGFGYIGWNLLNDKFKDRNVRRALSHLLNRELMNQKFRFGMSLLATGPWYQQSPYAAKVKPIEFNPVKASKMLKKAGWVDSNKDGVLDKKIKGKLVSFKFVLLFPNPDIEKYLTIYKEDLKKAGIVVNLKNMEWNSFLKTLDDKKFEAVNLGWGGGSVHNDPKQIWHSKSSIPGGSNFISYKNPVVDRLIDKGRKEVNVKKRKVIYRKIYKLIAKDAPYSFLFNDKYSLYAHHKKVKFKKPTYKYGLGSDYWWITQ